MFPHFVSACGYWCSDESNWSLDGAVSVGVVVDGVGSKKFGIVPTKVHDVWTTMEIHVTARGSSCRICLNQGLSQKIWVSATIWLVVTISATEGFHVGGKDLNISIELFAFNFRKIILLLKKCFLYLLISENEDRQLQKISKSVLHNIIFSKKKFVTKFDLIWSNLNSFLMTRNKLYHNTT